MILITSLRSVALVITSFGSYDRWSEHFLKQRRLYPVVLTIAMHCFTVSRKTFSGVCSRSRTRQLDCWRAPGDATTSHQFCRVCIGCRWRNGSISRWPFWSSSRCVVKLYRTSRMTPAHCGLQTSPSSLWHANALTVPRTNTRLGDRSFDSRLQDRNYGTVHPQHCDNLTSNSGVSNDFSV